MSDKQTKAELLRMLAEAVRNTQPQLPIGATQPDPIRDAQPTLKRTTKAKNARTSAKRNDRRR